MAAIEVIAEVDNFMQAADTEAARDAIGAGAAGAGGPDNAIKVDPNIFAIKDLTGDGSASQQLDLFKDDDGLGKVSKATMGFGFHAGVNDFCFETTAVNGGSAGQMSVLINGGADGIAMGISSANMPIATGAPSLALGIANTKALGPRSLAIGSGSEATSGSTDSIAAGNACLTEAATTFAFGNNCRVNTVAIGSTAIGVNAFCDRRTSVMLGGGGGVAKGGAFQSGRTCAKADTTDATPTILQNYGTNVALRSNTTWAFSVLVSAHRTDVVGDCAGHHFTGLLHNVAGVVTMVGTPNKTVLGEVDATWDCDVVADDAINSLAVTVTGAAGKTIRWTATIDTAEAGS